MFNVRAVDLDRLNSATKYPSIPTYHAMGDRGLLQPEAVPLKGQVAITEKIDGTNSRIIFMPDQSYIIGSREELLYARGDLIGNPSQGIVKAIRSLAEHLAGQTGGTHNTGVFQDHIIVFFLETFGANIGNGAKNYTGGKEVGFRLFDVADIPLSALDQPPEQLARWREQGGQSFRTCDQLELVVRASEALQCVPYLNWSEASTVPTDIVGTHEWLKSQIQTTRAALDERAKLRPEGVVVRTRDRQIIVKLRFEDYERTTRKMWSP